MPQRDPVTGSGTRDLSAFNRWLAISRLRAVTGMLALVGLLHWTYPGAVAVGPALGVILWAGALSALVLAADETAIATRRFLVLQTLGDLLAICTGIFYGSSGDVALAMRPLLILVVIPVSLLSVPLGLLTATALALAHGVLLLGDRGGGLGTLLTPEFLVPAVMFFLVAQQCFFYGDHLAEKNAALAAMADEVRVASALKTEFVGAVSHELRSPLNVILGYAEMALDGGFGPLTPPLAEALERSRRQTLGLVEMIAALLDLNRYEAGRVPVERTTVAIGPLLQELQEQVPDVWRRPGVAVRVRCATAMPSIDTRSRQGSSPCCATCCTTRSSSPRPAR